MTDYVAIHSIERARTSEHPRIAPGEIFKATDEELPSLIAARAIRLATDDEVALAKAKGLYRTKGAAASVALTQAQIDRDTLEARAEELGVSFSPRIGDASLAERIAQAEEKAKEAADKAATAAATPAPLV